MKLLLFENLWPLQQDSQQRSSWSLSLEEEEPSVLLELPSFAGDGADNVVETTASVSRSNFRLSRLIVRLSWSSRAELATMSAYDDVGF